MKTFLTFLTFLVLAVALALVPAASAQTHDVALSWTASVSTGVTGYNVYRAPCTGTITGGVCSADGAFAKLTTTLVSGTTYTDSTVAAGNSYDYYVTAVCATCNPQESAPSNKVAPTIPGNQPLPPTNVTITSVALTIQKGKFYFAANWADGANAQTQFTLTDANGNVVQNGTRLSPTGIYSDSWSAKRLATPLTFRVCDALGCAATVVDVSGSGRNFGERSAFRLSAQVR